MEREWKGRSKGTRKTKPRQELDPHQEKKTKYLRDHNIGNVKKILKMNMMRIEIK